MGSSATTGDDHARPQGAAARDLPPSHRAAGPLQNFGDTFPSNGPAVAFKVEPAAAEDCHDVTVQHPHRGPSCGAGQPRSLTRTAVADSKEFPLQGKAGDCEALDDAPMGVGNIMIVDEADGRLASVRVGLQGIYTGLREVFAYELLYRTAGTDHAQLNAREDHDRATAHVLNATFGQFGAQNLSDGRRLFLNTPRSFIVGGLPLPFEPEGVVLEVLETVDVDHRVMAGLRALKRRGFEIAVDDFDGELSRIPAVRLADYVKIDLEVTGDRLPEVLSVVRKVNPAAVLVVERVETEEQFQTCISLGVDLFQGYLLHKPQVVQQRTLTADDITCVQLIVSLSEPETPVADVVDQLSTDTALSLRVLTTVSSAAYAPRDGVTSLQQAVVLLGRQELLGWVTLVLLAGSTSTRVSDESIAWIFTLAEACRLLTPADPDAAFTLGLLSAAAEVLGLNPEELTRGCSLKAPVAKALLTGTGPLGVTVTAVRAYASHLNSSATAGEPYSPRPRTGQRHAPADPLRDLSTVYLEAQLVARSRVSRLRQ